MTNQIINSNGVTIPITFNHVAVQIVINIVNADGQDPITQLLQAAITEPLITDNVSWDLITGVITPATSMSENVLTMNCEGTTVSTYMLPADIENGVFVFNVWLIQEFDMSSCAASIPFPQGGFQAGKCYEYEMIFDADSLMLGNVNVLPWKEEYVGSANAN